MDDLLSRLLTRAPDVVKGIRASIESMIGTEVVRGESRVEGSASEKSDKWNFRHLSDGDGF